MFMSRCSISALMIIAGALAFGCGGTESPAGDTLESSTTDALSVVSCNPRDPASCDRGESCISLDGVNACTTGRCLAQDDCRDGYTCRANHCLRVERSVDRCDPIYHPVARGTCRQVLGYYWNGRICVGLSGCTVTDAEGLFRTERACRRTFEPCAGR